MSVPLLTGELGDVLGVLDHLLAVVATGVAGEDVSGAVGDADEALGGDEGERLADQVVRDGVVIEIEVDVRRLPRSDRLHLVALEGVLRQGQEPWALLLERIADEPAGGIARHPARVGDALDPVGELGVEILHRGEASRREEAVAQVLDRALNLTLFIPPVWGTGFWRVVIVA